MNSPSPLSRFGSSTSTQSLVSTSTPTAADEPTPIDLLLQTPPAVLRLLTLASPIIESTFTFVQLITWTHPSFFSSLLVLLSWWAICLFGSIILRFGLPSVLLIYILGNYISNISTRNIPVYTRHHSRPLTLTPSSYSHLLQSSQSLATHAHALRASVIHPVKAHMSFTPQRAGRAAPVYHTAWFAVTSYPFYLLLTWLMPMRMILLALGSAAILWNAPFFRNARYILWQSAAVRWSCRIFIGLLRGGRGLKKEWSRTKSGVGIPGLLGKLKSSRGEERPVKARSNSSLDGIVEEGKEEETVEGDDVKLQFTVFENQRWWVGLDWTHALLPGERASWTDPALNPSSPPSSFSLPPPTVMYTPSPSKADPNARLKTTTEWKWLDPEWKVLRTSSAPLSPTSTSSPPLLSLLPKSLGSTSAFTSTSPALSASTLLSSPLTVNTTLPPSSLDIPIGSSSASSPTLLSEELLIQNWQVDDDGWQYGDNHFEKMGAKGGLGKFTRRRAWVRSAGLVERCEKVGGEKVGGEKVGNGLVGGITSSSNSSGNGTPSTTGITRVGSLKVRSGSGSKEREKKSESPSTDSDLRKRKSGSSTLKNSTAPIE